MSTPTPRATSATLTSEMSPPPAWTPGKFLSTGDSAVLDMTPVYDPALMVRGQSSFGGSTQSQDVAFKPQPLSMDTCGPIPRGSAYLIVVCCVVASLALGLLAYIHL